MHFAQKENTAPRLTMATLPPIPPTGTDVQGGGGTSSETIIIAVVVAVAGGVGFALIVFLIRLNLKGLRTLQAEEHRRRAKAEKIRQHHLEAGRYRAMEARRHRGDDSGAAAERRTSDNAGASFSGISW